MDTTCNNKITGYTIYNAEQKRRTIRNDLPDLYPDLPEKNMILYMQIPHGIMEENFNLIKVVKGLIN